MTRKEVIEGYLMNSQEVLAEMLYDTIEKYENKVCATCKWRTMYEDRDIYICEMLVSEDIDRGDEISLNFGCNKWEEKK